MKQVPNSYIFHLSDGKIAIVQAPWGGFHLAHIALANHIQSNDLKLEINESHKFEPTLEGWDIIHSNGELSIELVVS